MSNYYDKYLKYKKKYIDLKNGYEENLSENNIFLNSFNKYGGGEPTYMIFFYDNTNKLVNDFFSKIKTDYKSYTNSKEKEKKKLPFYVTSKFKKDLNLLFNIFVYTIGDTKVMPYFNLIIDDLHKSNRMTYLRKPFKKAVDKYIEYSKCPIKNKDIDLLITKDTVDSTDLLRSKAIEIKDHINKDNILNDANRINSAETILQLIQLYQELSIIETIKEQSNRIGQYIDLKGTEIIIPSGITVDINFNSESLNKDSLKTNLDKYVSSNDLSINKLKLDITKLEFNNINDMICFKVTRINNKIQVEVTNTFDNLENTAASDDNGNDS
jgi:hypothetical protein